MIHFCDARDPPQTHDNRQKLNMNIPIIRSIAKGNTVESS